MKMYGKIWGTYCHCTDIIGPTSFHIKQAEKATL